MVLNPAVFLSSLLNLSTFCFRLEKGVLQLWKLWGPLSTLQRLIPSVPCRPGEEKLNINDPLHKCPGILWMDGPDYIINNKQLKLLEISRKKAAFWSDIYLRSFIRVNHVFHRWNFYKTIYNKTLVNWDQKSLLLNIFSILCSFFFACFFVCLVCLPPSTKESEWEKDYIVQSIFEMSFFYSNWVLLSQNANIIILCKISRKICHIYNIRDTPILVSGFGPDTDTIS